MSRAAVSLRTRLRLLGFVAVAGPVTVLLLVTILTASDVEVVVAPGMSEVEVERDVSGWVLLTAALLAVPVGGAASWWAARATRPIELVRSAMDEIEAGSLDRRLRLEGAPAEVQGLADSFDRMLDRVAAASEVQQQLVEATSHALRTPLAVARTSLDVVVGARSEGLDEHREDLERARRAIDRLAEVVDGALADARAADRRAAQAGNDLVAIARAAVAEHEDAARLRGVRVELEGPPRLLAAADGAAVRRALGCLLDNALRCSPPGGDVVVTVAERGQLASVSVSDRGPGIERRDQRAVFERGWQGDHPGGSGLGLAIVEHVADAHEGLELESPTEEGGGTRITLRFRR